MCAPDVVVAGVDAIIEVAVGGEGQAGLDARLVLYVRDMRAASVYACETGKFSDWMRVAYR